MSAIFCHFCVLTRSSDYLSRTMSSPKTVQWRNLVGKYCEDYPLAHALTSPKRIDLSRQLALRYSLMATTKPIAGPAESCTISLGREHAGTNTPLARHHSYLNHFDISIQLVGIINSKLMHYVHDMLSRGLYKGRC
jgi:hypothetical protein